MLFRYFYLDATGLLSLHSQLHHKVHIESTVSKEDSSSNKFGWSAALKSLLGVSAETTSGIKEAVAEKFTMSAENLLNEIQASLRAVGKLHGDLNSAIASHQLCKDPVWISGRFPFHAVQFAGSGTFETINHDRALVLSSRRGGDGYQHEDSYYRAPTLEVPQIDMIASLHKFPGLRDGYMGVSSHEAMFFRRVGAAAHSYKIFGSLYAAGASFQIKPYAISV